MNEAADLPNTDRLPLPTWPTLAARVAEALPIWDSWCPDDGRPAAALAAARHYVATPTPAHHAALESALAGAKAAWLNALQTDEATWAAGGPHGGARGAAAAAFAVLSLGHMLCTSGENQAAHGRNAASHATLALLAPRPLTGRPPAGDFS